MKMKLTTYEVAETLCADEYANWSRAGALALAEWLEEMEESTGEETEFDLVAIRCDFSEYESLQAWAESYFSNIRQASDAIGFDLDMDGETPAQDDDELDDMIREYIQDNGILDEYDGGVIVSEF